MPSTNQTPNIGLSQFVGGDAYLMSDRNADNLKIDQAVQALRTGKAEIYVGTYTGDGTHGVSDPTVLTFPFAPKLVLVNRLDPIIHVQGTNWFPGMFIRGMTECHGFHGGSSTPILFLTWNEANLSLYASYTSATDDQDLGAITQFNESGVAYIYAGIG